MKNMANQLVINIQEEKVNVAILSDGVLQEIFSEEDESLSGNIYVGRIEKIIPGLNAAFVNIGGNRNGFLKLTDITKQYISEVTKSPVKEGIKILVQVKHDAIGTKGHQLTGKISLAGRFLVYFPLSKVRGVSKKVQEPKERVRLQELSRSLAKNDGVVIRTAAEFVPEEYVAEEFNQLKSEWRKVLQSFKRARKIKLLRREPTTVDYILRERLNKDIDEVHVNTREIYEKVKEVSKRLAKKPMIYFFEGDLFDKLCIYSQIGQLQERIIHLPSGGYIALDTTEAMTVFDVNSASFVSEKNHADLAYKTNVEAAYEIARQLRLRNIGGIVIVDFIDMPSKTYYDRLTKELQQAIRNDSAHIELIGFTKLGLLEMTRKRRSPSIDQLLFSGCPICKGTGKVVSPHIVVRRVINELSKIENISEYSSVKVILHQRLSGYTEKIKKSLSSTIVEKIRFSFEGSNPGDFSVVFTKKTS